MKKTATGTREWAAVNANCLTGCSHDCRYCYARERAVRFKQIPSIKAWRTPRLREADVRMKRRYVDGWVMFPSSHDILPAFLDPCMEVIGNLLAAGNRVLLVTKPHFACVHRLGTEFYRQRQQILWRFTIGATTNRLLAYWEPGAPVLGERLAALRYAHDIGFRTSVSMEPLLDAERVDDLIDLVNPYVTETIWIGAMNRISQRVVPGTDPDEIAAIVAGQTPEMIRSIYERWKGHPKIRWKDSYRRVLGLGLDDPWEHGPNSET